MGYFSNGTESAIYQDQYCCQCVHDVNEDCPIWLAHLLYNGRADDLGNLLHTFIPLTEDGLYNKQCVMFVKRQPREDQDEMLPFEEAEGD